jgi:hypothetical protein
METEAPATRGRITGKMLLRPAKSSGLVPGDIVSDIKADEMMSACGAAVKP